jgi:phycocyanobilin lyase beta subunit
MLKNPTNDSQHSIAANDFHQHSMSQVPITKSVTELIDAVDRADSSDLLLDAVRALAAARDETSVPKLIEILGYNNPGAAVAAVEGLIEIGRPAVIPLLEQLDEYNYGARAWAIRALAGIGDPRGLKELMIGAGDFALSVRRAAARGLGIIRWEEVEPSRLASDQLEALATLLRTTEDPEWVVRYAAVVGLQNLAIAIASLHPAGFQSIQTCLQHLVDGDETPAVRARAALACTRITEN